MIELITASGLRRSLLIENIVDVCELSAGKRSSSAITLKNGETIFVADPYDQVMKMYNKKKQEPDTSANESSH